MAGLGIGMKAVAAGGEDAAEQIARLLREGRAAEVTDEMLGALTPNDQAKLFEMYESGATGMDLPMDEASRMGRAKEQGHSPGMFHGTASDIRKFHPPDARNSLGTHMGTAEAANERLGGRRSAFEKRMMAKRGMADPENIVAVTRRNESPLDMEDMIHWAPEDVAARLSYLRAAEGLDINQVPRRSYQGAEFYDNRDIVNELSGAGYTGMRYSNAIEDAGSTSEVVFDPANIRSRHARFDPRLSKNADLLASRAPVPGAGGVMATRPTSPAEPSGDWPSLSDVLGRLTQAFGLAGRAGIEGMATALSGVDEQGRSVGSILPFAKDERTGEVGLTAPRILDLWNTAGGVVPAKGITLGAGPVMRRAYENAPDSLMGFRRSGENVPFDASKYKYTQELRITLPNGETFDDAIKGLNKAHAIERARRNWPGATNIEAADQLPMDQASRAERAKAQGADLDKPLFHGSESDVTEFRISKGGELGPGVYVTHDPNQASEYARRAYNGPYSEGANVQKLAVKGKMKEMERDEWVSLRGEIMDRLRDENGGEWDSKFVKQAETEIISNLEDEGFIGIYLKNPIGEASMMYDQGVVFDPKNIRSAHAVFDPAKRDSADLLASRAAPGSLGIGGDRRLTYSDIEDWL